jgi:hypothetical protein
LNDDMMDDNDVAGADGTPPRPHMVWIPGNGFLDTSTGHVEFRLKFRLVEVRLDVRLILRAPAHRR